MKLAEIKEGKNPEDRNFTPEGYEIAKKFYEDRNKHSSATKPAWEDLSETQQDYWAKLANKV